MASKNKIRSVDHGFDALMEMAQSQASTAYVKVGLLGGDDSGGLHEVDPATGKASPLTITEIGIVNEFGTEDGHVPERSFLRSTFDALVDELTEDSRKLALKVIDGAISVETWGNILGLKLQIAVKNHITQGPEIPPHNAPSTVARKEAKGAWNRQASAGVRTLIDTGRMLGAITWAVVTGRAARDTLPRK